MNKSKLKLMVYHAIGVMSGSSLDGLDIAHVEFHEQGGNWKYEIRHADCFRYSNEWSDKLRSAIDLDARSYLLLHCDYGHYIGEQINKFIEKHHLQFKIGIVASHGHTSFHMPLQKMTGQLGDGAAIASELKLPVVTDLRAMDVAFGGQGAPIVPVGEKLLLDNYDYFLNIGGIANISSNDHERYIAYDICAANRVLNMLAAELEKEYDDKGEIAASGKIDIGLLDKLNALDYYKQPFPKSLANDFGTDIVFPMMIESGLPIADALRTYTEHLAIQISNNVAELNKHKEHTGDYRLLVTGGGAFNSFLIQTLSILLKTHHTEVVIPDPVLINFKEAMIMAFIGVLRWRQEYNVFSTVTGAKRNSIGGALWTGEEA
jgi:anhydro-N-acetylmuramic acid kinase